MPKIEIREKDLTSAGNFSVTTNTVYIPGYANMGPVNTPTLCETVEDFMFVFGSEPYRFRNDQAWNFISGNLVWDEKAYSESMGLFYQAGDYEKSYIMAKELLRLGIPVLYERVFKLNRADWTAKKEVVTSDETYGYDIEAVSPGLIGKYIKFKLTSADVTIDLVSRKRYILTVSRDESEDLGTSSASPVETYITLDPKVAKMYTNTVLLSAGCAVQDLSGLVTIKIKSGATTASSLVLQEEEASLLLNSDKDTLDEFSVRDVYDYLVDVEYDATTNQQLGLKRLEDKGEYVLKFITSGAYPTFELKDFVESLGGGNTITHNYSGITSLMMTVAANRGDCTALIDHTPNNNRALVPTHESSVYYCADEYFKVVRVSETYKEDCNIFASMFTPYGIYETTIGDQMLPASFGYLSAFAVLVAQYNGWLATAGVTRGAVPGLKSLCQNLTNAMADSYQPRDGIAINPITNIRPYGLTIWGARTLKDNSKKGDLTATSFLNIRQITSDVKRQVYVAAKTLTFEQNSDILWIKFKNKVTPLLDNMINSNGISAYELKRQKTDKKATVKAVVRLYAIEPVEDWDITIELADSTTDVIG